MKRFGKVLWKLMLGGGLAYGGYVMLAPQMGETALTGSAVLGIALLIIGIDRLTGAFD